jgi:HEAT repeat protein
MPQKDNSKEIFDFDKESWEDLKKQKKFKNNSDVFRKSEELFDEDKIDYPISRQTISNFVNGHVVNDRLIYSLAIVFNVIPSKIIEMRKLKSHSEFPTPDLQSIPLHISINFEFLKSKFQEELKKEAPYYVERTLTSINENRTWTVERILESNRNFIILGEPGIGKTTFIKRLSLNAIERKSTPINIDLRSIDQGFESLKTEVLAEAYEKFNVSEEYFPKIDFVFLFDHLEQTTSHIEKNINRLKAERILDHRQDQFIVCCRINSDSYYRNLHEMTPLFIDRLSLSDVKYILKNESIRQLNAREKINNRLLELGRNPQNLTLLMDIYKLREGTERGLDIARETEIYKEYVEEYINNEVAKRGVESISLDFKLGAIAALAFEMQHTQSQSIIKRTMIDSTFRKVLPVVAKKNNMPLEDGDVNRTIKEVVIEGIVSLSDRNHYVFIHDSLREFFCAWHLAKNIEEKTANNIILEKIQHPQKKIDPIWEKIIIFYAGLVDDITCIVSELCYFERNDIFLSNILLSGKCIAEANKTLDDNTYKLALDKILEEYLHTSYEFLTNMYLEMLVLTKNDRIVIKLINKLNFLDDSEIRKRIGTALEHIGSDEVIKQLIKILKNRIRKFQTIESTNEKSKKDNIIDLMEMMFEDETYDHNEQDMVENAIVILGHLRSEEAIEPIAEILQIEDWDGFDTLSYSAIEALGEIGSEKTINLLVNILYTSGTGMMRRSAAAALGQIGSARAIEPLINRLNDNDKDVRMGVAAALGQTRSARAIEPLINRLNDNDKDVRMGVAAALGQIDSDKVVDLLIPKLQDKKIDRRILAVKALKGKSSIKALEALIHLLEDKESSIRIETIHLLKNMNNESRIVEAIIKKLDDENKDVRLTAVEAFTWMPPIQAIEPLISRLNDIDEDPQVRSYAARSLVDYGSDKATEAIIENLDDQNKDVRSWCAISLGIAVDLGQVSAEIYEVTCDKLINRLMDEDKDVRISIIQELGRIGSEKSIEPLIEIFTIKEENNDIQATIANALGQIGSEKAVEPLIAKLDEENRKVRSWVAPDLTDIGITHTHPMLVDDQKLRYYIVQALGKIGSEKVIGSLCKLLHQDFLKETIVNALYHISIGTGVKITQNLIDTHRTNTK